MKSALPHSMPHLFRIVFLGTGLLAAAILLFTSGCTSTERREVVLLDSRGVLPPPYVDATERVPPTREPVYSEVEAEPLLPLEPWGDPEFKPDDDEEEFTSVIPEITAPPIVESAGIVYTVQSGDNLWSISRRYGISHQELAAYNNMDMSEVLRVGRELRIPPGGSLQPERSAPPVSPITQRTESRPTTASSRELVAGDKYTVRRGDSLSVIARDFGVGVNDIKALNDLRSDVIYEGQTLVIPQDASGERTSRPPREDPQLPELVDENNETEETIPEIERPVQEPPRAVRVISHTVIDQNETLEDIADMYGVTLDAIHRENPDLRGRALSPDTIVKVPVD